MPIGIRSEALPMRVLGLVGPRGRGRVRLRDALVEALVERGTVATVSMLAATPSLDANDRVTRYGVGPEGKWVADDGLDLDERLDRLAPAHDYALVEGHPAADLPTVVLGEASVAGRVVARAPDAESVVIEDLVETVEDLDPRVTLESLVERVRRQDAAARGGALATFTGRVRRIDHPDDVPTEHLEYEKYEGVADDQLSAIRDALLERDGVHAVAVHHRTGVVEAGDDAVHVVVLAGHRAEAFQAVEDGIDRIKDEVALFKKEVTLEDAYWHPKGDDT